MAGKDVVQLYTSLPYTEYDKEHAVKKQRYSFWIMKKQVCCSRENLLLSRLQQMRRIWQAGTAHVTMRQDKGNWILDAGDYYFTVGNGSHEAVNNVLAAQGMTKANGMTDAGNAANVKKWTLDTFDSETFAYSKTEQR